MDIALLRTFLQIAKTRHFGKAAEALFVTPSAVSARVKLLESSLGVQLLTRKRNDIQLTPAGNRLLKHAETIVRGWERARHEIALKEEAGQPLALGFPYDLWSILARDWVLAMRRREPASPLQIETQPADTLVQRLVNGTLDLALLFEPPQIGGFETRHIDDVALVLVADRPGLDRARAMADDYLMVDWGASFALSHADLFPEIPPPTLRIGSGTLAVELLLDGGGSAYLAEPAIREHLERGRLFPVVGAPTIERAVFAFYRSTGERLALIRHAVQLMRAIARSERTTFSGS